MIDTRAMPNLLAMTSGALPESHRVELLDLLWEAQAASATINARNASNETVRQVAPASLDLAHSLASAILATGGLHAPVTQAREAIFHRDPTAPTQGRVPGFGNSFHKGHIDPAWQPLAGHLQRRHPETWERIDAWHRALKDAGKTCHPNAASLTAAVCELVGWPIGLEAFLVIAPRLIVWTKIHMAATSGLELMR